MQEDKFLSLYDYLGYAAGSDLGKEVAKTAAVEKIGFQTKFIKNKAYSGEIMMYPKSFLDKYFGNIINDELPF
jgi:hypothetical protein